MFWGYEWKSYQISTSLAQVTEAKAWKLEDELLLFVCQSNNDTHAYVYVMGLTNKKKIKNLRKYSKNLDRNVAVLRLRCRFILIHGYGNIRMQWPAVNISNSPHVNSKWNKLNA